MPERAFDVVLFGASGFTGRLTAEYLARHAQPGTRWALAGRNRAKLEQVREGLAAIDGSLGELTLLEADAGDPASLRAVAEAARVVITTVGPYVLYGEPLVAACAAAGTDYVDLTGEPEFVNQTYVRHHATAERTGARLVHSCGFDSIPHDLGAYYTVQHLPADVPITLSGYVATNASFSGGTAASALLAFSRPRANISAARQRKAMEQPPAHRRARAVTKGITRNPTGDGWAVPLPTIDPQVVVRSARALERYGPDFRYSHCAVVPSLPIALGGVAGVSALMAAAQLPPARKALQKRLLQPGEGPSAERRARSTFSVSFIGTAGATTVRTRVSGGDPGYDETAKMLAESALCLAFDDLAPSAGQVTTATAMGDALLARLQRAGMDFRVL